MRTILAILGLSFIGIGATTIIYDCRIGICVGIIILGTGLIIDAVRK